MTTFLITGGAGFVGSNLAMQLKGSREQIRVIALDNLMRRGSELNLSRLHRAGVEFVYGDVRQSSDLEMSQKIDCIIDCAAEPSALAGVTSSSDYVVRTNLVGTLNALKVARRHEAAFVFLSSSRVYPYTVINELPYVETDSRFELSTAQPVPGASVDGLSEAFPLVGHRSLYGATKLASELVVAEYLEMYSLPGVIDRCGVIAGPWQMGKVDQGFVTHWVARHVYGGALSYKGFGGLGKQVRDVLHIDDLCRLVDAQIDRFDAISGQTFNVGGGITRSVSLRELTEICSRSTGRRLTLGKSPITPPADVRYYVSDCARVQASLGWEPTTSVDHLVDGIARWLSDNRVLLEPIFGGD